MKGPLEVCLERASTPRMFGPAQVVNCQESNAPE